MSEDESVDVSQLILRKLEAMEERLSRIENTKESASNLSEERKTMKSEDRESVRVEVKKEPVMESTSEQSKVGTPVVEDLKEKISKLFQDTPEKQVLKTRFKPLELKEKNFDMKLLSTLSLARSYRKKYTDESIAGQLYEVLPYELWSKVNPEGDATLEEILNKLDERYNRPSAILEERKGLWVAR